MSSVDSRIVTMKFDNVQFEQGVSQTINSLAKLKGSLDTTAAGAGVSGLANATKGLQEVNAAAGNVNLAPLEGGITRVSAAWAAMATVAVTALSNVTTKVMSMGSEMAKNLSGINAIKAGFSDYELKIGATQTIMAGTGEGIGTVTKYLKDLDIYADKTIYSLADMTSNIGKFTNAGVKLPVAVGALKGVAQVAALAGANSNEASRAMYNLGQAIGQGKVRLMDWKSVELANMGTKEFKEQLIDAAVASGTLNKASDGTITTLDGMEVSYKNFSTTLEKDWLTSNVLTDTLNKYADASTAIGKKAYKAATEVKTFSMMMETLKAAAGTGWTDTFEILIGNLPEATKLWTGITEVIGGAIGRSADARNKMLGDWKKLGGRDDLIQSFANVWKALGRILQPIHEAFRDIFPPTTGRELANFTEGLRKFTEALIPSKETSEAIGRTFKGIFAIFGIGAEIIKGVIGYFLNFFSILTGGGGEGASSILGLTGSIGDLLVKLHEWLVEGGKIAAFFDFLKKGQEAVWGPIIAVLGRVSEALGDVVSGAGGKAIEWLKDTFDELGPVVRSMGAEFQSAFSRIGDAIGPVIEHVGELMAKVAEGGAKGAIGLLVLGFRALQAVVVNVADAVQRGLGSISDLAGPAGDKLKEVWGIAPDTNAAKAGINEVKEALKSTTGVADHVKSAWSGVVDAFKALGKFLAPVWEAISGVFGTIKDKIGDFFKGMGIEDALALINTAFFIMLYRMFSKFAKSLSNLSNSMAGTFNALTENLKVMQQDVKANVILKIAAALLVLSVALLILSRIPMKELAVSMGALGIMMIFMGKMLKMLDKLAKDSFADAGQQAIGMIAMSTAMVAMGLAMLAFAGAVAILGRMKTEELVKGVTAIGVIMGVLVASVAAMSATGGGAQLIALAAGLVILSVAMVALAGALQLWANLDGGMIANGMLKMALSLIALGLAMQFFPPNMFATAAGLFVVAGAVTLLSGAMKLMATMSVWEIAKSLAALGGAMWILSAGIKSMQTAMAGAGALLMAAAAIAILVPSLVILGNTPIQTIIIALLALAGVFAVLGIAAFVLAPLAPILMTLAGAFAIFGVGLLAVGAGMFLVATAFAILAASGAAGTAVLAAAVISLAQLIPLVVQQIGLGLIAAAKVIHKAGPPLIRALGVVLRAFIKEIIKSTPLFAKMLIVMIRNGLRVIRELIPDFVKTGIALIVGFLGGVAKNISDITKIAVRIIVGFINTLAKNIRRIINAGVNFIIAFIRGLADAIDKRADEVGRAGLRLAEAIINGMWRGLKNGAKYIKDMAVDVAKDALKGAMSFLGISSPSKAFMEVGQYADEGFALGLSTYARVVNKAAEGVADGAMRKVKLSMMKMSEAVSGEMDVNPVISPVLDLSQVKRESGKLGGIIDPGAITAGVSYSAAAAIAAERVASQTPSTADSRSTGGSTAPTEVNLTQNNYSPKALSTSEIYRQTKSQMALAKEALKA